MPFLKTTPISQLQNLAKVLRGQLDHPIGATIEDALDVISYSCYIALGSQQSLVTTACPPMTEEEKACACESACLTQGPVDWLVIAQLAFQILGKFLKL